MSLWVIGRGSNSIVH